MKLSTQLRLEELAIFAASIYLFTLTGLPWWGYWACLLLPDLAMLGYLAGPHIGAGAYNVAHSKALGIAVAVAGLVFAQPLVCAAGIILVGHSAMDRVAGYGLKYSTSFKHTHLGNLK